MTVRQIPVDLQGLSFAEQTSWSDTSAAGSWTAVGAFDIKFEPTLEVHNIAVQQAEADRGQWQSVPDGMGGKLTFKTLLRGGSGYESLLSKLAKGFGTTRVARAGGAYVTGGTTSTLVGLDANLAAYTVGDAIMTKRGTNWPEIRFITQVAIAAGDATLTVEPNWTTAPVSGDSIYAIDTLKPGTGLATTYLTFKVFAGTGATNVHQFLLTGCVGTWKIATTAAKALPMIEWEFYVDTWTSSETAATASSDGYGSAHPLLGDAMYIDDTATLTANFGFDPGLSVHEYTATSGDEGRAGWLAGEKSPKVEITPYHDTAWLTKWDTYASATFHFMFESVKDTNEAWAVYIPVAQVTNITHEDAGNKHFSTKPVIEPRYPGTGTDDSVATNKPLYAIGITGSGS